MEGTNANRHRPPLTTSPLKNSTHRFNDKAPLKNMQQGQGVYRLHEHGSDPATVTLGKRKGEYTGIVYRVVHTDGEVWHMSVRVYEWATLGMAEVVVAMSAVDLL